MNFLSTEAASLIISALALAISGALGLAAIADRWRSFRMSQQESVAAWAQRISNLYVSLLNEKDPSKRDALLNGLWIEVDYGRLYFPNDLQSAKNIGRRSSILDPLVETHKRGPAANRDKALREDFREFSDQLSKRTKAFDLRTSPEAANHKQYRNP